MPTAAGSSLTMSPIDGLGSSKPGSPAGSHRRPRPRGLRGRASRRRRSPARPRSAGSRDDEASTSRNHREPPVRRGSRPRRRSCRRAPRRPPRAAGAGSLASTRDRTTWVAVRSPARPRRRGCSRRAPAARSSPRPIPTAPPVRSRTCRDQQRQRRRQLRCVDVPAAARKDRQRTSVAIDPSGPTINWRDDPSSRYATAATGARRARSPAKPGDLGVRHRRRQCQRRHGQPGDEIAARSARPGRGSRPRPASPGERRLRPCRLERFVLAVLGRVHDGVEARGDDRSSFLGRPRPLFPRRCPYVPAGCAPTSSGSARGRSGPGRSAASSLSAATSTRAAPALTRATIGSPRCLISSGSGRCRRRSMATSSLRSRNGAFVHARRRAPSARTRASTSTGGGRPHRLSPEWRRRTRPAAA